MTTADPGFALPSGFEPLAEHGRVLEVVLTALEQVEEQLDSALGFDDLFSDTAAHHLMAAGGKRVRPVLTVLASLLGDPALASGEVADVDAPARQAAVPRKFLEHILLNLKHAGVIASRREGPRTIVDVGVRGAIAPWRCTVGPGGRVIDVMFVGDEGAL